MAVGYWNGLDDIARNWALDREFRPQMAADRSSAAMRHRWTRAVARTLDWEEHALQRTRTAAHPQDLLADLFVRASLLQRHESALAQTAKPCLLMAGELPGAGFDRLDRRGQIPLSAEVFDHLAVTDRLQRRAAELAVAVQQSADFVHKAGGEHGFDPAVDSPVQDLARPAEDKHAAAVRRSTFLKLGLQVADRTPGGAIDFQCGE